MFKANVIIPARGGSTRIPNKNIQEINGTPLIALTIRNLLDADIFQEIFVSTDSAEIREISIQYGASCPFLRPADISGDFTPTIDVVKHALNNISVIENGDIVVCVYPTAVLITPSLYRAAKISFLQIPQNSSFLVSIARYSHPIQRSIKLDMDSRINFIYPEYLSSRTQDLDKHYFDAGQFYIGEKSLWLNANSVFDNAYGFEISSNSFIDIDYPENLEELKRRLNFD